MTTSLSFVGRVALITSAVVTCLGNSAEAVELIAEESLIGSPMRNALLPRLVLGGSLVMLVATSSLGRSSRLARTVGTTCSACRATVSRGRARVGGGSFPPVRHAAGTCSAKVVSVRAGAGSESVADTPSGGEESGLRRRRRPLAAALDPPMPARAHAGEVLAARLGAVGPGSRTPSAASPERTIKGGQVGWAPPRAKASTSGV
jgi:hypothetical protein